MKKVNLFICTLFLVGFTSACGGESKSHGLADQIEDGVENVGEEVEEGADKTAEEIEEAAEALGNVFGR